MKDWTIMVYLAGKNNLSDDMITAIMGIKAGLSSINNNISVLAQYDCQHPAVPIHRYDFTKNPDQAELLDNECASTGESIYDFVEWCVNKQPAKRYALILSGHGDGFQSKTLLLDESRHGALSLQELRATLEQIKANFLNNRKLDILGFDSCVMNTLEGTFEMRNLTEVWIGSQGSIPNSGWAYEKLVRGLGNLSESRLEDSKEVAKVFVTAFIEYSKNYSFGGRSVDITACDLSEIEGIAQNVSDLSQTLTDSLGESQRNRMLKQTVEQMLLTSHWKSQTYMYDQTVDLRDFCENLREESQKIRQNTFDMFGELEQSDMARELIIKLDDICSNCEKIIDAVAAGRLVIKSAFSGADYQYSYGISLFFPWSYLAFNVTLESYAKLEFVKEAGRNWWNFLEFYLDLTMRNPRNKSETKHEFLPVPTKTGAAFAAAQHRDNPRASRWASNDRFDDAQKFTGAVSSKLNAPNKLNISDGGTDSSESRSNPTASRDNMPFKRLNASKRGLGNISEFFGRTKNFPLNLNTSGGEE